MTKALNIICTVGALLMAATPCIAIGVGYA
jgi:hypothetical protein